MPLYLKPRDNRWQFSFGSKYMVLGDILADPGTAYVAGGAPILLARDPEVKASRSPFVAFFSGVGGLSASYWPSDYPPPAGQAPSSVLNNVNGGKLQMFLGGQEITSGDLSTILQPGTLVALLIFQGME